MSPCACSAWNHELAYHCSSSLSIFAVRFFLSVLVNVSTNSVEENHKINAVTASSGERGVGVGRDDVELMFRRQRGEGGFVI